MTPSPAATASTIGDDPASKAGFLFKSTEQIKADHPEIPAFEEFDDLLAPLRRRCKSFRKERGRDMNEKFQKLGFYPADILLPKDADMTKWAVVACDQFTSQPEYWQAVEETVGDAPSTLRLILPEAKLNDPDVDTHIADINGAMNRYLAEGVFQTLPGSLFYIERTQSDGKVRHGLIGMVDLDQYDFTPAPAPDPGHGGNRALPDSAPGSGAGRRSH